MVERITIGLLWHSMNSDNLGVGALTVSNIALLREAATAAGLTPHFLIIGWKDPRPHYSQAPDVEMATIRTREIARPGGRLAALFRRCDIVFDIGAGDSFTDIYGAKRFLTIWATKLRTILNRRPLVLSPQTIGPFETAWARPLARHVMNQSRMVVSRDAPSTRFLEEMGVRATVLEATDVAMHLPYSAPASRDGGRVRVGFNVSGLLFNGGYTQSNQFGLKAVYPDLVRAIAGWFTEQAEVDLEFVGHVQSATQPVEDDQRVGESLAEEFPASTVSPVFSGPSEAKSHIAGYDFFIGARMHATIAAFSSGVPVVPMAYSRKFIGVFGTLGYPHVADCKTDSADEILTRIQDGYARRAALAEAVEAAMGPVRTRLDAYREAARAEITRAVA